jgi:hypothetical protein
VNWALAAVLVALGCGADPATVVTPESEIEAIRIGDGPIIEPATHPTLGENIQGPSLIRVPEWLPNPLGRYYLYFADHKGRYIRLAYADELTGPWRVHEPGSLQLADSHFPEELPSPPRWRVWWFRFVIFISGYELATDPMLELTAAHIASPDVHVDHEGRRIVMYFHGLEGFAHQLSRAATSLDGVHFEAGPETLGKTYLRGFEHRGQRYAMSMPGQFYRASDWLTGFEAGPVLFQPEMRHAGLLVRDDVLHVFWSRVGDNPERILHSTVDLSPPFEEWENTEGQEVLRPERSWEGADAPLLPSLRSVAYGQVNQLRDPAIYEEDGRVYLLYAIAGEAGIAIAELRGIEAL